MPAKALRASPEKVATPLEKAPEVPLVTETPPLVMTAVTVPVAFVTTLPAESSILTVGCWARAAPLLSVVEGWVPTTSWVAAPADKVMPVEAAEVKPPPVNWRV